MSFQFQKLKTFLLFDQCRGSFKVLLIKLNRNPFVAGWKCLVYQIMNCNGSVRADMNCESGK